MELKEYWPSYLQALAEFRQIAGAEQPEFTQAAQDIRKAPDDFFLVSLSEYGCSRWEAILGISADADDDLEVRRERILISCLESLSYTMRMLEDQLKNLCGPDGYSIHLDNNAYSLAVQVALSVKNNYDAVYDMLKRIVPANMVITLSVKYNQHETLAQYTHAQLHSYTHDQLRNEVLN